MSLERIVGGRQLWNHMQAAIERLPAGQRAVLVLRDLVGCTAAEACTLLGITTENQRVLLHRARGRIRAIVDTLVGSAPAPVARGASPRTSHRRASPLGCWIGDAVCGLSIVVRECLWTGGAT